MADSLSFEFSVTDFREDTRTIVMNTAEIGAYFLILLECYARGNNVSLDMEELAVVARLPIDRFERMWNKCIARCFQINVKANTIAHKRVTKELARQKQYTRFKSDAGKKGALKRWKDHDKNGSAMAVLRTAMAEHGYKEEEEEEIKNKNTHTQTREALDLGWPAQVLLDAFPDLLIQPGQLNLLETTVTDTPENREAWQATVNLYIGNHDPRTNSYMPSKIGTVLDMFKKEQGKISTAIQRGTNGTNKPLTEREKSAERGTNGRNFADELERQGLQERQGLLGGSDANGAEVDITRQLTGTH